MAQLNDTVEELPAGAELHHEVDFDLVLQELSECNAPRAQHILNRTIHAPEFSLKLEWGVTMTSGLFPAFRTLYLLSSAMP